MVCYEDLIIKSFKRAISKEKIEMARQNDRRVEKPNNPTSIYSLQLQTNIHILKNINSAKRYEDGKFI